MSDIVVQVSIPVKGLTLRTRTQWSRFLGLCAVRDVNKHLSQIELDDRLRAQGKGRPWWTSSPLALEDPIELTYY